MFILLEFILNLTISIDLGCRVKMAGFHAFMNKNRFQNKLDFLIVVGCNLLFLVSLLDGYTIGEISDEFLLLVWSVIQTLRILMIARNQKKAIEQAKFLINFTDIGIETEREQHGLSLGGQQDIEEDIVFDEQRANQGSILQNKAGQKKPRKKSIEMQDFR
uniref:Uncharacterized protein n=1 Tax=Strombidium inclinatum TaxID=197538 RepID=A0A7S3MVD5_9SPIT|mmetsp:Transcript_19419/g.29835  ORF Transcript_19419/g.29835 Transcript_19419/m.29835 type:complete len:161 (+) Transcript_19419:493-975(+)